MPSLEQAFLRPVLLRLDAVDALIDKAAAFCSENGLAAEELAQARLAPDMLPFAFQIKALTLHSRWAIECLREGTFRSMPGPPPSDFAALKSQLAETAAWLCALELPELELLRASLVVYEGAKYRGDFKGEAFLMQFTLPNFYFHAAIAYGLLRASGVPIGKFDFLGQLPVVRRD